MPAIVEADDGQLYVMKFVGAGQGPKALIAELLAGELARHLGLQVPELALMQLPPEMARSEPDPEIQDLLRFSAGRLNLGLRYLPNALDFNMLLKPSPSYELASKIVWFDAYITNVDRTARNVNLLMWHDELWLIDHGAALYFHHSWEDYLERSRTPFKLIKDHTLLRYARHLPQADAELRPLLGPAVIKEIVGYVPGEWLASETTFANQAEHRAAYSNYLQSRLQASSIFVEAADHAHHQLV